ncbi:MAG: NUDIX hydrolase [Bacilli bacterium]|nr:NUDIX hydrolase [Bacilli bacterium]
MNKKIRKAVRTFLIKDNNVVATKYKTVKNLDYYDIPGGKIEEGETSQEASIREVKEETGIQVISQKYKGNVIIECPNMIFDFDVYIVKEYDGIPSEFDENDSMWINIDELLKKDKKFASIEILKYINLENIKLKIYVDENHNILKIEM